MLDTPNAITTADFEDGCRSAASTSWATMTRAYTALIAWNDGEEPLDGVDRLRARQGGYVYTGISFFRELPAGVPGAYRLFANLISSRAAQ